MVIDLDHIGFGIDDLKKGLNYFSARGYQVDFIAKDRPNPLIKNDFMESWSSTHNLVRLTSESGCSIELINHGHANSEQQHLLPILLKDNDAIDLTKLASSRVHRDSELGFEFIADENCFPVSGNLRNLVIGVDDLSNSAKFWGELGFQRQPLSGGKLAVMTFSAPLFDGKLCIVLNENMGKTKAWKIDSFGFNSMAFIVSNIEQERKRLSCVGCSVTDIVEFRPNEKTLKICFIGGPGGELVELIGVSK